MEGQGASKRPATDLKGCYALVYQREDANQGLDWMKLKHSNSELAGTIEEDVNFIFLHLFILMQIKFFLLNLIFSYLNDF